MRKDNNEVEKVKNGSENAQTQVNLKKLPSFLNIFEEYSLDIEFKPFVQLVKTDGPILLKFQSRNEMVGARQFFMDQKAADTPEKMGKKEQEGFHF